LKKKSSRSTKKQKKDSIQAPSVLDRVYSFPSYSSVNDQFSSALSLCKRSRELNKSSGVNVAELNNNHKKYKKLRSEIDTYSSVTTGGNSVDHQPIGF
jgi:hypothetical protein